MIRIIRPAHPTGPLTLTPAPKNGLVGQPANPLAARALRHLRTAISCLQRNDPLTADLELSLIPEELRETVPYWLVRWWQLARTKCWSRCQQSGERLVTLAPALPIHWLYLSYAARQTHAWDPHWGKAFMAQFEPFSTSRPSSLDEVLSRALHHIALPLPPPCPSVEFLWKRLQKSILNTMTAAERPGKTDPSGSEVNEQRIAPLAPPPPLVKPVRGALPAALRCAPAPSGAANFRVHPL